MKSYTKWRNLALVLGAAALLIALFEMIRSSIANGVILLVFLLAAGALFLSFWQAVRKKGIQTDVDISRVLGRDAKDALDFGQVGIITYNDEYVITWMSDYFKSLGIDLVNQKLTCFLANVRDLFDQDVDMITGSYDGQVYEVEHKTGAQVLFVRNITKVTQLEKQLSSSSVVVGLMELDNYDEYQSYENDEILSRINVELRGRIITWARENGILIRRIRSDRFIVILDTGILKKIKKENFSILQTIKDTAKHIDVSITLSAVFAGETGSFTDLDKTLNELLELVQSRGGDQAAIKLGTQPVEFIGGSSEKATQRSTVRVRIVGSTIEDQIRDARNVYILGHVNTDYDAMGAALAASNWVRALHRDPHIVLKDVPRDAYLQDTMNHYKKTLDNRHNFITEAEALEAMDPKQDLLIMVDHSNPDISSGRKLIENNSKVIVIDHHRRGENSPNAPLLSYIESGASSTCELMTELLAGSSATVPIYEAESTIMYLGILVDTGRFRNHTGERTFQAAGTLLDWGANTQQAEHSLQEDYKKYKERMQLLEQAEAYDGKYLVDALSQPVSRTTLSQISDALLGFKGCQAAFTIGINDANGHVAVSARSDGTVNVQRIMEMMNGGGHFAAAALEREDTTVQAVKDELLAILRKEADEK